MKKVIISKSVCAVAILLTLASCNKNVNQGFINEGKSAATEDMISEQGNNPDETSVTVNINALAAKGGESGGHYLYTETNEAGKNSIIIYQVRKDGDLQQKGIVASGGAGTGKGLGSQGALAIDKNHDWLYAVNAGDNSVSVFKIHNNGALTLTCTENTKGTAPVSLSVHGNLLYVLNRGTDNIHGFHISVEGKLSHIAGSTQSLSGTAVDAPQVSISPDGNWVIVTEKATNTVGAFKIKNDGSVDPGKFSASAGPTPFGFDFARDRFMIVSNAAGGAAGAGSATSNIIESNGTAKAINGAVSNQQAAPCWVATTKYGRFAYVSNTGSNTVSSYYVSPFGALYLIDAAAGKTDGGPADIVVAANNYYVYVMAGAADKINGFKRKPLGGLESIYTSPVVPASATGLAVY
jgi:6-phosphogluconolactonase (cycloisomerase 2 family)